MRVKRFGPPDNINYCATVVELAEFRTIANCDNVKHAVIFGNLVVVSKDTEADTKGLFFPVETQLSSIFLKTNNLYRDKTLNLNPEKAGYFELNGRIRCVKFRSNPSVGFFIPIESLDFICDCFRTELNVGDEFDTIDGIRICQKYIPASTKTQNPNSTSNKHNKKSKKIALVDNQFRFHEDTSALAKNVHRIEPDSVISITYKLHGTSGITGNLLYMRNLSTLDKIAKWLKVKVQETYYDVVNSSRKVIKTKNSDPGYYKEDIWTLAGNYLTPYLDKGMTFYYEIVGYTPSGKSVQKGYDYGCVPSGIGESFTFGVNAAIYIYRITTTNIDGKVIELSAKQVQDFCKNKGLNPVPELWYGKASDFVDRFGLLMADNSCGNNKLLCILDEPFDTSKFLDRVKALYNEKECYMCKTKVPEEGCVVRIESNDLQVFKCKSIRFLEFETKSLDTGEVDMESEN